MKYLLLIYSNPASRAVWDSMSDSDRTTGVRAYVALNAELEASGEAIAHESLAEPEHTTSVRVDGDRVITSDGPFAETKEQLAGFYLVDCEDLQRAVAIAARLPEAQLSPVEVRPVRDLSGYGL